MIDFKKSKKLLLDPCGFFLESRHPIYRKIAHHYSELNRKKLLCAYNAHGRNTSVSVIMATYNAEQWIDAAISSLLTQTHSPAEIILIDDASSDKTCDRIKEWQTRDARIKFYASRKNVGPYACKNFAIDKATHNVIAFADADDISYPDRLALQLGALEKSKRVASLCRRLNCDEKMIPLTNKKSDGTAMASLMFKKDAVIKKAGYFDMVRFAADAEFTDRLRALYGRRAVFTVPLALYHARQHNASITRAGEGSHLWHDSGPEQNPLRKAYHSAYEEWHRSLCKRTRNTVISGPFDGAPFPLPQGMERISAPSIL